MKYHREYVNLPPVLRLGDTLRALCLTLKDERLAGVEGEAETREAIARLIVERAGELAEELEKRYAHVPR